MLKNLTQYLILGFLTFGLFSQETYSSDESRDEESSGEHSRSLSSESDRGDEEKENSFSDDDSYHLPQESHLSNEESSQERLRRPSSQNEEEEMACSDEEASSVPSSGKQPSRSSHKKRRRQSDKAQSVKVQDVSSDEESAYDPEEDDAPPRKRQKRVQDPSSKKSKGQHKNSLKATSKSGHQKFTLKENSDEEGEADEYLQGFCPITELGTRVKLLANIYLKNIDQTANVFLPKYFLHFKTSQGALEKREGFFKTPSGKRCVFVSGGIYNTWEKNMEYIYNLFFKYQFKIIRSTWIQKHLRKDKGIDRDLEKEFFGKETDLHSELYYDLFFRHFFIGMLPDLIRQAQKPGEQLQSISIKCFSWWAVCNGCDKRLSDHGRLLFEKNLLTSKDHLSYEIIARRHYGHAYPSSSLIKKAIYVGHLGETIEKRNWDTIWQTISTYTTKEFKKKKEKRLFWTTTKEGLEVCKWLGQAFRENIYRLDGRKSKIGEKGDILKFYREKEAREKGQEDQQLKKFRRLLTYLSKKNWDLSCWYFSPYPGGPIQQKWKRHWNQVIMPHFNWEEIAIEEGSGTDEEEDDKSKEANPRTCQMCGYEGLERQYVVFHEKFGVSDKYLLKLYPEVPNPRPRVLALYSKDSKLYCKIKDKEEKEITSSQIMGDSLMARLKQNLSDGQLPNLHDQEALFKFTFQERYTPTEKFWKSEDEKKSKACLRVGSECVKTLGALKDGEILDVGIEEWFETHANRDEVAEERAETMDAYDQLDKAESELRHKKKKE